MRDRRVRTGRRRTRGRFSRRRGHCGGGRWPASRCGLEFAAKHRIANVYRDLQPVLDANEIDTLVIASPSAVHAEQSIAGLQAGKHVLCEIPVGLSLEEANSVVDAARQASRVAMVCHTQRFWPAFVALSELIQSRALAVRQVSARLLIRRPDGIGDVNARSWVDSLLWHHGSHAVDAVLALMGDRSPDLVAGGFGRPSPINGKDLDIAVVLRNPSGSIGAISLSYRSRIFANDYLVITDEDSFLIDRGTLVQGDGASVVALDATENRRRAVASQTEEFISSIVEGREPVTSIQRILPTMRVLDRLDRQRALVATP